MSLVAVAAQVEGSYTDELRFSLNRDAALIEPDYWLADASVRYRFGEALRYEVTAWGRNLGEARYCVRRQLLGALGTGDVISCQPNEGIRFFGVSLFVRIG